ncbi:hypothetical protein LCGC14_0665440 [marine sediment metagenome]|uniref:ribonucleoside-diphosphate reductase n=1 Tax=marine sediment metagenome TaxID=412755 RepID=A0A0F9U0L5_9ZZZZ
MENRVIRKRLPDERASVTHRVVIDWSTDLYIIVGLYPDGQPGELFLKVGKVGSTLRGLLDILGIWTSILLQVGVPLDDLCEKMIGVSFEPKGRTNNKDIPECASIADYTFRWLRWRFLDGKIPTGPCWFPDMKNARGTIMAERHAETDTEGRG